MAKLRHIAVVVKDLEKAAQFYEKVFDLKRVGEEHLEMGSGIYLSDGVINLALLTYKGESGSGLKDAANFVGAHHFGFQVDDIAATQKKIEAAGGKFFFDLGKDQEKENFERKFKDPNGIVFDINWKGWQLTKDKVKNAKGGLVPATKRAAAARKKISKKTAKPGKVARKKK